MTYKMQSRRRRRAMRQAGMTLMEIMIVLVIVGMLATGIGVALMPQLEKAREKDTRKALEVVRTAVNMYRLDQPRACPSMDELVRSRTIDSQKSTVDAWGNDFIIQCDRSGVTVTSPGADGQVGTEDDIR